MKKYFNITNFGSDIPYNWSDICDVLNREAQDRIENADGAVNSEEIINAIWEDYQTGDTDAPYRQYWSVEIGPDYTDDVFTSRKLGDCARYLVNEGYYEYGADEDEDEDATDWRIALISLDNSDCIDFFHKFITKKDFDEMCDADWEAFIYNDNGPVKHCDSFDGESFGADCPDNWEEICEYLNGYLEDIDEYDTYGELESAANKLWEDYCCGNLPYAPKGIYDGPEYKEYDTHIEVPHFYPKDYDLIRADGNGIVYYVLDSKTEDKYIVFEWDLSPQEEKELVDKFENYCLTQSDFQSNDWKEGDFYEWAEEEKFEFEHLA